MDKKIINIANRFLDEKDCTCQELTALKKWFSDPSTLPDVENWLNEHWISSAEMDSNTLIENVFEQI